MATSAAEGRGWIYDRIARTTTPTIVDVGPGEGTYSILARHLRPDARWVAVEVHEPYIERYHLEQKYDEIVISNAAHLDWELWPVKPFAVLLGDVVEHFPYDQGVRLLQVLLRNATEIMVSVPIIESIQDEVDGNCHEAHLYQWGFEEMEAMLPGCESWKGEQVGRFWWKRQ